MRSTPRAACLGRQIQVVQYDTQSDIRAVHQSTRKQLGARRQGRHRARRHHIGPPREAIRQTFRRANVLYFYNVLYEGGVCDRNCLR